MTDDCDDVRLIGREGSRPLKHSNQFKRNDGTWLPEHIRLAIERTLLEFVDCSCPETHASVAQIVKKLHPSLPMSERDLQVAVERITQSKTEN